MELLFLLPENPVLSACTAFISLHTFHFRVIKIAPIFRVNFSVVTGIGGGELVKYSIFHWPGLKAGTSIWCIFFRSTRLSFHIFHIPLLPAARPSVCFISKIAVKSGTEMLIVNDFFQKKESIICSRDVLTFSEGVRQGGLIRSF